VRRITIALVWVTAVALAINAGRLHYAGSARAQRQAAIQELTQTRPATLSGRVVPFTIALSEVMKSRGRAIPGLYRIYAQRSDGAFAERLESVSGPAVTIDREVFLPDRLLFVNDVLRRVRTNKMIVPLAESLRNPDTDCLFNFRAGRFGADESIQRIETIDGHRTARIDSRGLSQWFATDLGCAMIRQRMQTSETDVSEQSMVFAIAGEPNPSLFQVARDYVEATQKDLNVRPLVR
jgi:hypothetical protein